MNQDWDKSVYGRETYTTMQNLHNWFLLMILIVKLACEKTIWSLSWQIYTFFIESCVCFCVHIHVHTCTHLCLVEEGRALVTVSEKSDTPSPSPLSERRSWSSSPPHSLYTARIPRKQQPDHLQRTSAASGRPLKQTHTCTVTTV